jgi:hypothetical protein
VFLKAPRCRQHTHHNWNNDLLTEIGIYNNEEHFKRSLQTGNFNIENFALQTNKFPVSLEQNS